MIESLSGFINSVLGSTLIGAGIGAGAGATFILALFIGFCVLVGFTKTTRTTGNKRVVKSLEEAVNHQAVTYFAPTDPRGPADQLKSPELVEAAARRS